jgi:hypothetical protein
MEKQPIDISNDKISKLRDHINNNFNAFNENGELQLDKCQRNVAYSIGHVYTNYNGLLMQERHKLDEIREQLSFYKAKAYNDIKMNKAYDIDAKGMTLLLEGHEEVRKKQLEYDKQETYIKFLEYTVKQIGYYANGVNVMLRREELRAKYGE